jgi:hypothetical protein
MLFPRNALASGPQACFFTGKNKSEGQQARLKAKLIFLIDKNENMK